MSAARTTSLVANTAEEKRTPWLAIADGEGSADVRICRTHAEIVQFLCEQLGVDYTGSEEKTRNFWFAYLEDGDNWQSRDGAPQFRCDIEAGETGRVEIQWMGDACNSFDALTEANKKLREALEYYAVTPSSYGQVARAALKGAA